MKTKIKSVSPDQNIIEHESGLKTVFVIGGSCDKCVYCYKKLGDTYSSFACGKSRSKIQCGSDKRRDGKNGHFKPLLP
mgnify:CR=1 FL=1